MSITEEVCSYCGKIIAVDEQAYLEEGKIVCRGCDLLIEGRKSRESLPATDKQKAYASSLGIEFDEQINRAAISELIDQALAKQAEERDSKLNDLQDRESKAYQEMHQRVLAELEGDDKPLSKASPSEMAQSLGDRGLAAIIVTFDEQSIDSLGKSDTTKATIVWSDQNLDQDQSMQVIRCLGVAVSPQLKRAIEQLDGQ